MLYRYTCILYSSKIDHPFDFRFDLLHYPSMIIVNPLRLDDSKACQRSNQTCSEIVDEASCLRCVATGNLCSSISFRTSDQIIGEPFSYRRDNFVPIQPSRILRGFLRASQLVNHQHQHRSCCSFRLAIVVGAHIFSFARSPFPMPWKY